MPTEPKHTYIAPITFGFIPADGDLIRGTVNGVEVSGKWVFNSVKLFDSSKKHICSVGFNGAQYLLVVDLPSAPTTDYELHLYRHIPAGIVQIPQEYVEGLEETTANANQALETATAAQNTANTAKNTANTAKSTADTAKNTANTAKSTADTAKSTADTAKSTADTAKSTADTAKSTANTAKSTAESAQSTANAAKTTAERAIRSRDGYYYRLSSTSETNQYPQLVLDDLHQNSRIAIYATPTNSLNIMLNRDGGSLSGDPFGPATIKLVPNGVADDNIIVDGAKAFIMPSSTSGSTKKFKITVDDTGTISATEVTT